MQKLSRRALFMGGIFYLLSACTHGQSGDLRYSIQVSGEGNELVVTPDLTDADNAYVIVVASESGIGEGTIAWWGNALPHHLSFQLHLSALEHFNLRWGEESVTVNVNSTESFVLQSVTSGQGSEVEIDPNSPYWIKVTPASASQMYIELTAPMAFLNDSPQIFTISWIDYYR